MTRLRATWLAVSGLLLGGGLLGYTLLFVSPFAVGDALNPAALLAFFAGLFLMVAGLTSLVALALHLRWPALAGKGARRHGAGGHGAQRSTRRPVRRAGPGGAAALRQGILCGLVVAVLSALAILGEFDVALALLTLLLASLVEAFAQTR